MEFAAGISHELRTPLAVIQSAAHNLGAGVVRDREDIEEYAAIVKTEARRLTDMVEHVMAYTRRNPAESTTTFPLLISETSRSLRSQHVDRCCRRAIRSSVRISIPGCHPCSPMRLP
jgi:signal transduction histidine kinase